MARGGRERKRLLRRGVPRDATDRLSAAEARIDGLSDLHQRLVEDLELRIAATTALITAQNEATGAEFEAVRAQAKEDYRRQVGVLDVVRRQQKRQDETFGARVDAVESAVGAIASEQATRLAQSEGRVDQLEVSARMLSGRVDAFETFRVELGDIVERMSSTIRAIRDAVEKLALRTDATDALAHQQLTDAAALREQVLTGQREAETIADTLRAGLTTIAGLESQVAALTNAMGPLGPLPSQFSALTDTVMGMNDRVVAAELVLNQRTDLDLQLERAEEFERVLAEVDPADYAMRSDLDTLRQIIDNLRQESHPE
ncbi:MAG: hypothetical protein F2737_08000 [Actinobacteria bacterium]|uniref:Unannotated protein n=1 Tax=freshwater metagenome TaxID=449393 RepID=A0A6J6YRJ2_9ZZZZ|nr:hypothetical protein [Actinomycetota bacterium]